MDQKEHLKRHKELHRAADELAADYLLHHPSKLLTTATIMEFLVWANGQATRPTTMEHEIK